MPQKTIHKKIKVITDQNIVKGQKQNGFPMRKWKISLAGVNANGDDEPMPYVDYVEYILHQTFEQPLRKVTEYPFVLQEKGWGEFDMKIMLHFVEKSVPPFVLDHDLNFQQNHYEMPQTITFSKIDGKHSFLKLLNSPATNASDRESSNDSTNDGSTHKRRREALTKEKSKRIKDDRSSDDDSLANSSAAVSGDEDDKIDVHQLAKKFQMLHPDDLIPLVNLVKANQTSDMYVKEDGEAGEFHIDLRTLGDSLLAVLWKFCDDCLEKYQKSHKKK
ncbi:yeats family-domain-containing protein [Linnemannia elongata]|nr:yeats family-domain-containing protein [Linnemannia elongata]